MKTTGPIVITGFMGCGKTMVARQVARLLNLTAVDLDNEITAREGASPAQLIVERGEAAFRSIESKVLRDLLKIRTAQIIALGGGAWITEANRKIIDEHLGSTVWLDAPFEVCWERIEMSAEERPLGRTKEQARLLFDQRRPIYQLASIHIQVTASHDVRDLASQISTELSRRPRI